ncbi:uncharacterized protein LOC106442368 [Brassica napus]|uniref:uncharacterized protein LOC106442368 n=1 Tax=Brassica napus TaxID=3708 RepID=UPI0006AB5411|nr:uncharacterized protein LOC106442368 [Brassica napus]
MDSAIPPSSSEPPGSDREVLKDVEGLGVTEKPLDLGLKKGDSSWVLIAKEKRVLRKYDVEVQSKDGKCKVAIPDDIFSDSTPLWEEFVVGKFLDIAPHIAKVHMVVNKIWSYGDTASKVEVYDVDARTMRFKVSNSKAREKVIKRGMWNIAGVPMVVKKWTPKAEEEKQEDEAVPMWVHLRKIPLSTFSWEALSFMMSTAGHPIRLHPETIEFTAAFYYPWLPSKCNLCEKWGHTDKVCGGLRKGEKKVEERDKREEAQKDMDMEGTGGLVEKSITLVDVVSQQEVSVESEGKTTTADRVVPGSVEKIGNDWALVSPDKEGEITEAQEEDSEEVETVSISEEDRMEDEIFNQKTKEKEKTATQKGGRRGFNKDLKHSVVTEWVNRREMKFGSILESRVKEGKAGRILNKVFRDWSSITNYEDSSGGRIWLIWRDEIRMTPVYKSDQIITCSVELKGEAEFYCSCIYASNQVDERKTLWEDLAYHHKSPIFKNKAWIIMGDFNKIIEGGESSRFDNMSRISAGMRDFQRLILQCQLTDMAYQGPKYTWCNKREDGIICKKLDRVLLNEEALQRFRNAYSIFEPGGCSDHMRCIVQLFPPGEKIKRPFKYINVIGSIPDFLPMVQRYWDSTERLYHSTSAMFRFSKKLKFLKPLIREMGRDKLGNLSKQAKEAFDLLCDKQKETLAHPTDIAVQEEADAYGAYCQSGGGFFKTKS